MISIDSAKGESEEGERRRTIRTSFNRVKFHQESNPLGGALPYLDW